MKLYDYPKSSAAYRVRIALNLKGLKAEQVSVNLLEGAQKSEDYKMMNPQGLVPTLETEQGYLSQSLAILEYLEVLHPQVPLLPENEWDKAQVRSMAYAISCDIHPLNNLRVLKYLTDELSISEEQKQSWYAHWIQEGFQALENKVGNGNYCFADTPSLADVCLVPQMYNARRFDIDLSTFPKLVSIDKRLQTLPEISAAAPEAQ